MQKLLLVLAFIAIAFFVGFEAHGDHELHGSGRRKRDIQAQATVQSNLLQTINISTPDLTLQGDDEYICIPIKLEDIAYYIVKYTPRANMNVNHHMLLYGCTTGPGYWNEVGPADASTGNIRRGSAFNCGEMGSSGSSSYSDDPLVQSYSTCQGGSQIVYAWAMGAPALSLPADVSFKVGKDTRISTLVLQMHYKDRGTYQGGAGITLQYKSNPSANSAGIYLLGSGGDIPAHSKTILESACRYNGIVPLTPIRYRTHSHTNGVVISGWRVHKNVWTELGRKSPQLPQMFYNVSNPDATIKKGDVLAARCVYNNSGSTDITIGPTKNDEMCNFYLLFSVPAADESILGSREVDPCFTGGKAPLNKLGVTTEYPSQSLVVPAADVHALASGAGDHHGMPMTKSDPGSDMSSINMDMNSMSHKMADGTSMDDTEMDMSPEEESLNPVLQEMLEAELDAERQARLDWLRSQLPYKHDATRYRSPHLERHMDDEEDE